jgi:hypothetical protein
MVNEGGDAALAAGLLSANGGVQPGAILAAPQLAGDGIPGRCRGTAAFGAACRQQRRRIEPYVKDEAPASREALAVENLSESDEELLAACKRVEHEAAASAAAEVMARMGAAAATGVTA